MQLTTLLSRGCERILGDVGQLGFWRRPPSSNQGQVEKQQADGAETGHRQRVEGEGGHGGPDSESGGIFFLDEGEKRQSEAECHDQVQMGRLKKKWDWGWGKSWKRS